MLKFALPILLLAGITPEAREDIETRSDATPLQDAEIAEANKVLDADHDQACQNDPALVHGVDSDARLFRDPARPDSLQPMHAVDYEVNGCGLLVMTDGTLVRPPRQEDRQPVTLQPAQ